MCLGDLVGYITFPNEVIAFVRKHNVPVLMDNSDAGVGFDRDDCGYIYKDPMDQALGQRSLFWTRECKEYLWSLPFDRLETLEGREACFVHGNPCKINEYMYEGRSASVLKSIARAANADVLFFGHVHLPDQKQVERTLFVNIGTVGKKKVGLALGVLAWPTPQRGAMSSLTGTDRGRNRPPRACPGAPRPAAGKPCLRRAAPEPCRAHTTPPRPRQSIACNLARPGEPDIQQQDDTSGANAV